MLSVGDKLLIAHRRMFQADEPRYFLGEVAAYEDGLAKVVGFTFVRDMAGGTFLRKDDARIKIVPISSGAFIVYQLPVDTDVEAARFQSRDGELTLTDGRGLNMNLSEAAHAGHV